ncbi:MAG: hypothetical protein GKR97_18675 [Rhizobiaceae bacterium]|nr:hypothetical protein [Rhizobiaceae bacterium]
MTAQVRLQGHLDFPRRGNTLDIRQPDSKIEEVSLRGYPPQLFDLASDPPEINDLSNIPAFTTVLAKMREGVDLSGVANLSQEQLELSCGENDTQLPAGLTAPAKWPCGSDD